MKFPPFRFQFPAALATGIGYALLLGNVIGLTPMAVAAGEPSPVPSSLEDGTYLFGESARSNEVGKGYVVFSKHGQRVVGVLYYPRSEFSCFVGQIAGERLDLTAYGPYDRQSAYVEVPLATLHQIQDIGTSESSSLADCHQEIAEIENQQPTALQN